MQFLLQATCQIAGKSELVMKRNINLAEISDGKLYTENDMAKVGCNDCRGCSACCRGMGDSIILDPMDIYRLTCGLDMDFSRLLEKHIALGVVDGIILPHLRMDGYDESCSFLDEKGRCGIHPYRPGICRIFPLGRLYEDGDFRYFLQTKECASPIHTKVKVSKWIDVQAPIAYRKFLIAWHYLLNALEELVKEQEDSGKGINMRLLQSFYVMPYNQEQDFYKQFEKRYEEFGEVKHGGYR